MVNSTPFHPTLQSICLRLTLTRLKLFPASSNSSRAKHDAIIDVIKLAPGFLVFSLTIFTLTGVHALSSVFFLYVTSSQKNEISLEACLVSSLKLMSAVSPTVPCYYIISLSFAVKTYSHSRLLTYEHWKTPDKLSWTNLRIEIKLLWNRPVLTRHQRVTTREWELVGLYITASNHILSQQTFQHFYVLLTESPSSFFFFLKDRRAISCKVIVCVPDVINSVINHRDLTCPSNDSIVTPQPWENEQPSSLFPLFLPQTCLR